MVSFVAASVCASRPLEVQESFKISVAVQRVRSLGLLDCGTRGRTRTGTLLRAGDFESLPVNSYRIPTLSNAGKTSDSARFRCDGMY